MDVRLPNGTIIRNIPEGTSREAVFAKAQSAGLMTAPESPPPAPTTPAPAQPKGSLYDVLMQGLTLGYADELGGLGAKIGRTLAGAPPERIAAATQREIARQRQSVADVRERMPWISLGTEIAGALVSGGPLAKGLTTGFQGLRFGNISAPIAAATVEGGLAGAGASDENRLLGGLLGATLGGTVAGGMPVAGALGTMAGEKVSPLLRKAFEGPETAAGRVLAEYTQGAGETIPRLRARQRQLGPEATFADVAGPSGMTLGQGVIQQDPMGRAVTLARREMAKRAAGSTGRLTDDLRGITGVSEPLQESLDAVRARQKAASAPMYKAAYNADISLTPKLKNLLTRPPMQRAWAEAKDAAATRGEELPPFMQLDDFGDWQKTDVMPDMAAWDRMKQGIDRLIDQETDAVTGRVSPKGRDLSMLKRELVSELDDINPAYREAREVFAGDEAIQNAMRDGERFLTMKTREVKSAMDGATESEKQAFLAGAMEAIREKMGRAKSGDIGEFRFLETGNVQKKLRSIFPGSTPEVRKKMRQNFPEGKVGDKAFERSMREIDREGDKQMAELMRTLNRERTFASTQGGLIGGSQTALRTASGEAMKSGAALPSTLEMLSSPVRGALQASLAGASEAVSGLGQKTMNELGQLLFDPRQTSRAILEMQRRGIQPVDMEAIMSRWARGGANISPILGLGAGEMTNQ